MVQTEGRSHVAVYGAWVAALFVLHAVAPVGSPAYAASYVLIDLGAATATLVAVRRHRPAQRVPWLLMSSAFAVSGSVSVVWFWVDARGADAASLVSPLYLVAYGLALASLWRFIRARSPQAGIAAFIDAAIVTTGVAVLMWVFVVHPTWMTVGEEFVPRMLVGVYALLGLVLLAMVSRLTFGGGRPAVALRWMAAAAAIHFTAQIADALPGTLGFTGATALRMVATATLAVGALHPSMREVTEPGSPPGHRLPRRRLLALWAASVAAPLTLLVEFDAGDGARIAVIAVGSIALFTLVVARMWGLLRTVRDVLSRQHEDRFRALVEHADDVVMIVHPERGLTYVSPSVHRIWGYTPERLREGGLDLVAPEDRVRLVRRLRDMSTAPAGTVARLEGRGLHADGGWRHTAVTLASHVDDPAIEGVVATFRDVTSQRALELQLTHQTFHDPLTGLPNRALFTDRVTQALDGRDEGSFTAVIFLDLDDFKTVNDGLGHTRGDELLGIVARRLAGVVRPEDTVARFGGDEFAVLVPRIRCLDTVTGLAERLLAALTEPITLGHRRVEPTASLGIATSHDGPTATDLLRDADAAMYAAKSEGRGTIQVFDPAMHADAMRRLQLKMDLRAATDRGELAVVYQTIQRIDSGEVVGVEALLRWTHPVRGAIRPDEFIPLAEESGCIDQIGVFVLERACDDVARYRNLTGRDVFLTVNVSPVQLSGLALVTAVAAALERTGLPPSRLVLELTESVFIADDHAVATTLHALEQLGVQLAIDDFGTGYCSLAYLDRFRFDVVKVDKSFIDVLADTSGDPRLTVGILELIASLGVPAVAEGIETEGQLEALRAIGCTYGQGYLWSRPVPVHQLPLPADIHADEPTR